MPEGDAEVGRDLVGCRVLGKEHPQEYGKPGDRPGGGQRRAPVWQIRHLTLARLSWRSCCRALVAAGMLL